MRHVTCLLAIIFLILPVNSAADVEEQKEIPKSIEAFYPPLSKVYVFKETMLRMGLLFTAVALNAKEKKWEEAEKSVNDLAENYMRVPEMVPEWKKYIDPERVEKVHEAVMEREPGKVIEMIEKLRTVCDKCHQDNMKNVKTRFMDPILRALLSKLKKVPSDVSPIPPIP